MLLVTIPTAFLIIFMEMKVIAFMNLRIGPDRVGPWGTLLSVVHGLKVLAKEDFTPTGRGPDRVHAGAGRSSSSAAVMTFLVIPFAPGLFGQDFNIGLLYFFAVGGMTVVGLMMAGWASFNKYSLLGGLRAAAQIVSYEIPLTLSVVGLVLLAGTMSLNQIVLEPVGLASRLVRVPAAAGRADLLHRRHRRGEPHAVRPDRGRLARSSPASRPSTRGMRFGFLFFAEYVNVFIVSALTVTLFFGGWNAPFDCRSRSLAVALDPASLGIGAAHPASAVVPSSPILAFAAPFWMLRRACPPGRRWSRLPPVQRPRRRADRRSGRSSASTGSSGSCGS